MSILELFNLKDEVAVVTGAGKGIGCNMIHGINMSHL